MEEIEKRKLCDNAKNVGAFLKKKLERLMSKTGAIAEVRGMGLLIGIECKEDIAVETKNALFEKGYLVGSIGPRVIRLAPPLILSKRDAAAFISELSAFLDQKYA